jgi:hypothetical protein
MKRALKGGAAIGMGVDLPNYQATVAAVPEPVRESLLLDLTG